MVIHTSKLFHKSLERVEIVKPDWSTADGSIRLFFGDCLDVLPTLDESSIDSVVTDPPYGLEFMGKEWDRIDGFRRASNPADVGRDSQFGRLSNRGPEYAAGEAAERWHHLWAVEALRVLKPGGHLLAFGGSRTYHRLASAIEDAGFEIRDCIMWLYGSGFPKSLDVSKAIDKAAGAEREVIDSKKFRDIRNGHGRGYGDGINASERESPEYLMHPITAPATTAAREWSGWGTALKPAHEPIVVARKPLSGTVAANVLQHGTGGLNIDGCRIPISETLPNYRTHGTGTVGSGGVYQGGYAGVPTVIENAHDQSVRHNADGRWPANVIHDGSEEATAGFPESDGQQGYVGPEHGERPSVNGIYGDFGARPPCPPRIDTGSAARFFYCAKADASERRDSKHPTVKPLALMQYLVRLVTPPNGTVLDLFMGSGTTIEAAFRGNFKAIGIEREAAYFPDCIARLEANRAPLFDPTPFEPAPKLIQGSLLDTEAQT